MAIVRPKFAAAEQKKRDVALVSRGGGIGLDVVDAETGEFLATFTYDCGKPAGFYDGKLFLNYDFGTLEFDSDGRCRQFLKPDVKAMEAELEQAKAEVVRLREERDKIKAALEIANADVEQLRAKLFFEGNDESRMRWALGKMIAFAKKNGPSVDVYREGDVVLGCLGRIKTITEAAGLLLKDSKP